MKAATIQVDKRNALLARLAEAGHLGRDGDRVALTVRGRLLADAIAVELMAAG